MIRTQKKNRSKPALISITSVDRSDDNINTNICTAEIIPECIKKTMKYNEADILQINIKYPQIRLKAYTNQIHEKSLKRINKFYDSISKYFMKFSERVLYKYAVSEYLDITKTVGKDSNEYAKIHSQPFKQFGAVLNFEVTYNKNNFLCIYFDANIYSGKGRGNITRKAHIWDLSHGMIIPSNRFADFTSDNKKKICSYICEIMKNQTERGEEYYINTDFKTVYKYFNSKNMFITDRGYNFFFPQNSLSPAECGIVSFLYISQYN